MKITLRTDATDVEASTSFEGRLIARVSTQEAGGRRSRRWAEVEIYANDAGGFVLYEIGRSIVAGEVDRFRVSQCDDGSGVYHAIVDRRRLTAMDTDALTAAAAADSRFRQTLGDAHEVEDLEPLTAFSPLSATDFREIVLDRDGDRALRIRAREIGRASSRRDGAESWMEVAIFATMDGRYVTQKARCSVISSAPDKSAITVAKTGLEAVEGLVWRGSGWVQSPIVEASRQAAKNDERFAESVGDLLQGDNIRRLLGSERPPVSAAELEVLKEMQSGNALHGDAAAPIARAWERATSRRLPPTRVFLALSRKRLIHHRGAADPNSTVIAWVLTDAGERVATGGQAHDSTDEAAGAVPEGTGKRHAVGAASRLLKRPVDNKT